MVQLGGFLGPFNPFKYAKSVDGIMKSFGEEVKHNKVLPNLKKDIPNLFLNTGLNSLDKNFIKNFHQLRFQE